MLTRARSLFSRVFSLDHPTSQVRLDDISDEVDDEESDDNEGDRNLDDATDHQRPMATTTNSCHAANFNDDDEDDDDDEFSDSDDDEWATESRQGTTPMPKVKGKYERQINESPPNSKMKSAPNYIRSHEKSRHNRLISAMQVATSRCNVETMRSLLTNFDIDINHRDQYGMSYLEHAILMGSFDMVDLLIRHGCDLYQGDSNGHSYLYVAIETTSHKSLPIIRLLLESNCSCLRLTDIVALTSPQQLSFFNSQDFLLLNAHLLFILKYHIRRMVLSAVLNLISNLICTNIILCKNDDNYGLSSCSKSALHRFNHDYIALFVKTLGVKHALKLEQKFKCLLAPSPASATAATTTTTQKSLIPLNADDIQPYLQRLTDLSKQVPDLRHLCRLLVRQNLKTLKSSILEATVKSSKLQDYLLYTPI